MAKKQKVEHPKWSRAWIVEQGLSLGGALLLVFAVRSSIVQPYKIPSGSMIPTLLVGDFIFVNRFAYGLKVPFTDVLLDKPLVMVDRDPPKTGDVIVFAYPKDESVNYIKRVVGVGGDKIELRNNVLFINDREISRAPIDPKERDAIIATLDDSQISSQVFEIYDETLGPKKHRAMLAKVSTPGQNFGPITVPQGQLFVMGDNRDLSNDSRFWGFVPVENVHGKAMVIWFSLWMDFSESKFVSHPSRIGTLIH